MTQRGEPEPQYDGPSDRFWVGGTPLPRNEREAIEMHLVYDPATDAWWSGDVLVTRQNTIDRFRDMR